MNWRRVSRMSPNELTPNRVRIEGSGAPSVPSEIRRGKRVVRRALGSGHRLELGEPGLRALRRYDVLLALVSHERVLERRG